MDVRVDDGHGCRLQGEHRQYRRELEETPSIHSDVHLSVPYIRSSAPQTCDIGGGRIDVEMHPVIDGFRLAVDTGRPAPEPGTASPAALVLRHSIYARYLPLGCTDEERFRRARDAGFEGVEVDAVSDDSEALRLRAAAEAAGIAIHAVYVPDNWLNPLSGRNPASLRAAIRNTLRALECARAMKADSILLIPGIVTDEVSYSEAYQRSQAIIRAEILPAAEELGIVLAIENVWSGFLLSPLEYVRFIDDLGSPWAKALLDVGNMLSGHPEYWVRTVGARIAKLHVKDFRVRFGRAGHGRFAWCRVGEGAICWRAVRDALLEVGFSGWASNAWPRSAAMRGALRGVRDVAGVLRPFPPAARAVTALERPLLSDSLSDASQRLRRHLG
jgi:hexulose-6-phosphate isomerase